MPFLMKRTSFIVTQSHVRWRGGGVKGRGTSVNIWERETPRSGSVGLLFGGGEPLFFGVLWYNVVSDLMTFTQFKSLTETSVLHHLRAAEEASVIAEPQTTQHSTGWKCVCVCVWEEGREGQGASEPPFLPLPFHSQSLHVMCTLISMF